MVGRQAPLIELQHLAASVGTDGPVCVVVAGEAGIGKTRLLQELGTALDGSPPVLTGQARESEAQRTFGLVRDLVERSPIDAESVLATVPRWHHPLGHLLELLVRLEDHPDDGHTHGQEELARAGAALVGSLVDDHPALVIFEDLHWADGGRMEILGRLARGQDPLLLVATFRPVELEVVRLVARGYTNGQIADRLFVTTKTVSTHVSNALSKTGFQRRTQLGAWAVREGLADDG